MTIAGASATVHPSVPRSPRSRTLRRILFGFGVGFALVGIWFVAALCMFVLPSQQPLHRADAIVVLAPPTSRLPTALGAIESGLSDQLWISHVPPMSSDSPPPDLNIHPCGRPETQVAAMCFTPQTNDTIGEARAVGEIVAEADIDSVVVATDITHSARAHLLFERCLPAGTEVQMLLVNERPGKRHLMERMLYESLAYAKALFEVRACNP